MTTITHTVKMTEAAFDLLPEPPNGALSTYGAAWWDLADGWDNGHYSADLDLEALKALLPNLESARRSAPSRLAPRVATALRACQAGIRALT